jgi:membrane protein involved in colicin uptake
MSVNELTSKHLFEYGAIIKEQTIALNKLRDQQHIETNAHGSSAELKHKHTKEFQEMKNLHLQERTQIAQQHDTEYQDYRNLQLQRNLEKQKVEDFKQAADDSLNYADELEAESLKQEKAKAAADHEKIVREVEEETKEMKKQKKLQELLLKFNPEKGKENNNDNEKDR